MDDEQDTFIGWRPPYELHTFIRECAKQKGISITRLHQVAFAAFIKQFDAGEYDEELAQWAEIAKNSYFFSRENKTVSHLMGRTLMLRNFKKICHIVMMQETDQKNRKLLVQGALSRLAKAHGTDSYYYAEAQRWLKEQHLD
jgi:hypothetical protein